MEEGSDKTLNMTFTTTGGQEIPINVMSLAIFLRGLPLNALEFLFVGFWMLFMQWITAIFGYLLVQYLFHLLSGQPSSAFDIEATTEQIGDWINYSVFFIPVIVSGGVGLLELVYKKRIVVSWKHRFGIFAVFDCLVFIPISIAIYFYTHISVSFVFIGVLLVILATTALHFFLKEKIYLRTIRNVQRWKERNRIV